jgi:hypothetical protein
MAVKQRQSGRACFLQSTTLELLAWAARDEDANNQKT